MSYAPAVNAACTRCTTLQATEVIMCNIFMSGQGQSLRHVDKVSAEQIGRTAAVCILLNLYLLVFALIAAEWRRANSHNNWPATIQGTSTAQNSIWSCVHGRSALALDNLLVDICCNVFAAVHVRCDLQQTLWPDLCDGPGILLAGQYQFMVHNPAGRVLQQNVQAELKDNADFN